MRCLLCLLVVAVISSNATGQQSVSNLCSELQAKRHALSGLHQEFLVDSTSSTAHSSRDFHEWVIIDMAGKKWREHYTSGSDDRIRVFDGKDVLAMENGGSEFIRMKENSNNDEPEPYTSVNLDWAKAKEVERRPCGFSKNDHTCVVIEGPEKPWAHAGQGPWVRRLVAGGSRLTIDSETGVLVRADIEEAIDSQSLELRWMPSAYERYLTYSLTRMMYDLTLDPDLFRLPSSGMHEVKEFTKWDAARMRKELTGKPAPHLEVTDLSGKLVSLAAFKGKTVLLDFWTTWCPPCLADAPALDKLYRKYGGKNLSILGISVSEDRDTVQKFLQKHPHTFPIILTSENQMPRPYKVGVFPTYMVIAPDETFSGAFEGDQGFGALQKHLQKAGMDIE